MLTGWKGPGVAILAVAVCFGAGFGTGHRLAREAPPPHPSPVCRPSAPQLAADHAGLPIMPFIGNSLLFDHDWRIDGALAAICARQGLLAREAPALIASLPGMAPEMVVFGFGTVEVLRAGLADRQIDPAGFAQAAQDITRSPRARWPEARLVWLRIPRTGSGPIRPPDVLALNDALTGVLVAAHPGAILLDTGPLSSGGPVMPSYDGIHLTAPGYLAWERALARLVAQR